MRKNITPTIITCICKCECGHCVMDHSPFTGECIFNLNEDDETGFVIYCKCEQYKEKLTDDSF